MQYVAFAIRFMSYSLLALVAGGLAWMIYNGDIDARKLLTDIAPSLGNGASGIAVVGIAICVLLAALAPLIYAARSGDLFTVIVSIVALVFCFLLLTFSRTVIDVVLAAIVYFTSAFISVIMYATSRISEVLGKTNPQAIPLDRPSAERSFN